MNTNLQYFQITWKVTGVRTTNNNTIKEVRHVAGDGTTTNILYLAVKKVSFKIMVDPSRRIESFVQY